MKHKIFTLFFISVVVVSNFCKGMESDEIKKAQDETKHILAKKHRDFNLEFYKNSSTEIGRECYRGSLPTQQTDFWCQAAAVMLQQQCSLQDINTLIRAGFHGRYSPADIDEFVKEFANKDQNS